MSNFTQIREAYNDAHDMERWSILGDDEDESFGQDMETMCDKADYLRDQQRDDELTDD